MSDSPASEALKRFTVLDLTRVRSGPTCVRQLADWGANVIKIELPPELEGGNALGGARHGPDFQNLHRNKRAMSLNLKDPAGRDVFMKLAETADVIVENYRPDVKKRLGIDYEAVAAINPKIVYASISGFGQDGPYAKRPGFDQVAQGMGGLMSITGLPGQGPVRVGIPIADLTAGLFAAQGIFIALLEREVSGKGQWVQTSLLQAQLFMLDFQGARYTMSGEVPKQAGNNHPTSIPTGVFETADGHMNIAVAGKAIWERFCQSIDKMDWNEDPRFSTADARSANRDVLNAMIEEVVRSKTTAEWVDIFIAAGVPSGPIYNIGEAFEDPQVKHLEAAKSLPHPSLGDITLPSQPMSLSRTPSSFTKHPPDAGEQTDEILAEYGYDAETIADLRSRTII